MASTATGGTIGRRQRRVAVALLAVFAIVALAIVAFPTLAGGTR